MRGRGHPGWRALEAYRRLRDILVEELGLEPSPRLRRLGPFHGAVPLSEFDGELAGLSTRAGVRR
ncbi:BTAD domain-containing putative transcriptional regulator [Streptomyces sp. NPDC057486]|uniref:BTAD domain-containing putative transcriptional regulator n=1 Tax=Streptomyces sp. NPDC057486 TaxID=3346145 RepID=UPI0036B7E934